MPCLPVHAKVLKRSASRSSLARGPCARVRCERSDQVLLGRGRASAVPTVADIMVGVVLPTASFQAERALFTDQDGGDIGVSSVSTPGLSTRRSSGGGSLSGA